MGVAYALPGMDQVSENCFLHHRGSRVKVLQILLLCTLVTSSREYLAPKKVGDNSAQPFDGFDVDIDNKDSVLWWCELRGIDLFLHVRLFVVRIMVAYG